MERLERGISSCRRKKRERQPLFRRAETASGSSQFARVSGAMSVRGLNLVISLHISLSTDVVKKQ